MRVISSTEFRKNASDLLSAVEHGETLVVVRHGRPIAHVSPVTEEEPSWKRPALRLIKNGAGLSSAIIEERKA
ncbi:type II toxin-antitoxin system prevent-host-death family antitoxin [bacterium]|nr:type II toxin-antitoxin system prevent-host-death family antitoxin [bacterium]